MESNWLKLKNLVLSTGRLAIIAVALWVVAAGAGPSPVCAQDGDCCTVTKSPSFPKVHCVDVTITCDCDAISGTMEINNACCGFGCL